MKRIFRPGNCTCTDLDFRIRWKRIPNQCVSGGGHESGFRLSFWSWSPNHCTISFYLPPLSLFKSARQRYPLNVKVLPLFWNFQFHVKIKNSQSYNFLPSYKQAISPLRCEKKFFSSQFFRWHIFLNTFQVTCILCMTGIRESAWSMGLSNSTIDRTAFFSFESSKFGQILPRKGESSVEV